MTDKDQIIAELRARVARLERQSFLRGQSAALRGRDELGDCPSADDFYIPGCGAYDTRDSKGEPLRPYYNDAGEPYWM